MDRDTQEGLYARRYEKNLGAFSREELVLLRGKSACVVGCGGLGGHAAMTLARFGIGRLTLIDGDVFETGNLNRQVFCTEDNLGRSKAVEAKEALFRINSQISISAQNTMLTEENAIGLLSGHDIALDCLDNLPARLLMESECGKTGIPLVHGAVTDFYGQVCSVFPGDNILHAIYTENHRESKDASFGAPPFSPQLVAAIQCGEALKILAGKGAVLRKQLLTIDLLSNSFEIFEIE